MLTEIPIPTWPECRLRTRTFMQNFRVAVLGTIAFLALLMVVVALAAAMFDVSDRGMSVITTVLAVLPTLVTSLLVYLKVETVESKVDTASVKADTAAVKADQAARTSADLHHDIKNDVFKDVVRRALAEERHMLQNRETAATIRAQLIERGVPMETAERTTLPPDGET